MDYCKNKCKRAILKILGLGSVPSHIAFIMDGNRRFAKSRKMGDKEGHSMGFNTLQEILESALDLGVKEVTVYAFSIENFKRPKSEVDGLMELALEKFGNMLKEGELVDRLGVRILVSGDLSLISPELRKVMGRVVHESRLNTNATLNVCFAYTAREEMVRATKLIGLGIEQGLLYVEDIDENLYQECMFVKSNPDVLIRTSGEVRFSDFLLWQSSFACVIFMKVLWPDFTFLHFVYIVLYYQFHHSELMKRLASYSKLTSNHSNSEKNSRVSDTKRLIQKEDCNKSEERLKIFIQWVQNRDYEYFKSCAEMND